MKTSPRRVLAAVASLVLAACAKSSMPGEPSGGGAFMVAITPSAPGCYPRPNKPCTVTLDAVVTNARNPDEVTYAWSGCGSSTARSITCTIDRPGPVSVEVRATERGQTVTATATPTGTNVPPTVEIWDSILWESWIAARGTGSFEVFGTITDLELPTSNPCGRGPDNRTVTASGICTTGYARCDFLSVLAVGALKTAPSGDCTLTLTATDEWGAPSTVTKTFKLPTPHVRLTGGGQ